MLWGRSGKEAKNRYFVAFLSIRPPEKPILGGHVAAVQDDEVRALDELCRPILIPAVQRQVPLHGEPGVLEVAPGDPSVEIRDLPGVRA